MTKKKRKKCNLTCVNSKEKRQKIEIAQALHMPTPPKLLVFPSFDKCDALLYFPSTMTRLLNSGDFGEFSKLLSLHCHKNCDFQFPVYKKDPPSLTSSRFLELLHLMDELHPDSIMCCHSTKVIENEIQARLYFKITDSKSLFNILRKTVRDPVYAGILIRERVEKFGEELQLQSQPEHKQRQLTELLESAEDVTVYGQANLVLQFDEFSKKVTGLKYFTKFTSLISAAKPTSSS